MRACLPPLKANRRRKRRLGAAVAIVLFTRAGAAFAQADEQSELDKARNAYLAHQYDEADQRLLRMLDPKSPVLHDRVLVNQAHMYWGAVMLAKKHMSEAGEQFEVLLLNDPSYEPDPLVFPTDVVNLFIDTRARLRKRLDAIAAEKARRDAERRAREAASLREQVARLALLEHLAREERTVERHSRWIGLVPFGVGQFQNGQKGLGWGFLGTETALTLASAITLPIFLVELEDRTSAYNAWGLSHNPADYERAQVYLDRANTVRTVNLGLDAALLGVAVIGILQAQIAFVPEEAQVQKRSIPDVAPPPGGVSFQLLPVPPREGRSEASKGAMFGIVGRF